jgi:RNA polymerase sigma-70 factor (ECF subfamily)
LAQTPDRDAATRDLGEMRAIASGDPAAFARLIDREAPRLLRFAQGMLGSLEEAEDVVQETLLRLFENAATWEPQARIGTWLHRVCYNRSIDNLRRRRALVDEDALAELPDGGELPDAALVRNETVNSVRGAMARLPHRQRTAVLLFHFQDLAQRDAAAIMGISETAFESLLARARRQMRGFLGTDGDDDG